METIRCRISRYGWILVPPFILAGCCLLLLPFQEKQPQPFTASWGNFLLFGAMAAAIFGMVLWMVRSLLFDEIVADEVGVRWRGVFGPSKTVRWDEISDFYLAKGRQTPTIETPGGKIKIGTDFDNKEKMMATIAERALSAPTRCWEREDLRVAQNFTQRFDYWTKTQKWSMPGFIAYLLVAVVTMVGLKNSDPTLQNDVSFLALDRSWSLFWMPLLLGILVFGSLAIMFVCIIYLAWRDRRFAYDHRREHLEVSPRGLAWQRGEKRIEARWDEVRVIRASPGGFWGRHDYGVETQNGDFVVGHALERIQLWLELVRQFAPQIAPQAFVSRRDLGGEISTWSGAEVGEGARIFHFRTSETSFVLWMATIFAPAVWLILVSLALAPTSEDATPMPWLKWLLTLSCIVLTLFGGWLCFARAAIWADETGLQWRFPLWKTRRVAWSEIENLGHDEHGYFLVANGKRQRLFGVTPVRKDELLQLIATRATKATGRFD